MYKLINTTIGGPDSLINLDFMNNCNRRNCWGTIIIRNDIKPQRFIKVNTRKNIDKVKCKRPHHYSHV